MEAVQRCRLQTLLRRRMWLQIQHDGYPGCDWDPSASPRRSQLEEKAGNMGNLPARAERTSVDSAGAARRRNAACLPLYTVLVEANQARITRDQFIAAMTTENI